MQSKPSTEWTPLKQPFLPFHLSSKPVRRPTSAKSHHSDRLSQHNYGCQTENNSFVSLESSQGQGGEDGASYSVGQLLQLSKRKSKVAIDEDAAYLRQEIWLKIEAMFRRVWEYGQQFYSGIEATVNPSHPFPLNPTLSASIRRCLQSRQSLYSSERMHKISTRIIQKISKYLQEVLEKYIDNLFQFSNDMKVQHVHEERKGDQAGSGLAWNTKKGQAGHGYRSVSLQRAGTLERDREFQDVFNRIAENKDNKLAYRSQAVNFYSKPEQNPYCLNIETGKFLQTHSPAMQTSFFETQKQASQSRVSHGNSSMRNRLRQSRQSGHRNNISISPVISRVAEVSPRVKQADYIVGLNQQSVVCDWCEQVKLGSQFTAITVRELDSSLSGSKLETGGDATLCAVFCNEFANLAIGCKSSIIYVHAMEQGEYKQVTRLVGHTSAVCCLHSQPGLLYSGGDAGCCSIFIWQTVNWTVRSKLSYHLAAVSCILAIPNSNHILSASLDKTLKLYNTSTSVLSSPSPSPTPYTKLLYYEHLQAVVAMGPCEGIDIFEVDCNQDEYRLSYTRGILCGGLVGAIEKCGAGDWTGLAVGLRGGLIQLYKLMECALIKRIDLSSGPIISMVSFSRHHKSQYPLILFCCQGSASLNCLNTQTEHCTPMNTKGSLNLAVPYGTGPTLLVSNLNKLAWINQQESACRVTMADFTIH